MPDISIILSCYNTGRFLEQSIVSVINQEFRNWELIIVNDGSTDNSLDIASRYVAQDPRISVQSKPNGGLASARMHGLKFMSPDSRYMIFYDADDMMHPQMLVKLFNGIEADPKVGAIYCNHRLIDPENNDLGLPTYGRRIIPTAFWVKKLDDNLPVTPFISIFCWACRMIEPMTLLRRKAYDMSTGWDPHLGGRGNIGEGALLFSELALTWKIIYIHEPLYLYRKHPAQATASPSGNAEAGYKVLSIWEDRIRNGAAFSEDVKAAILFYRTRLISYAKMGSFKHMLRYTPLKAIPLTASIIYNYIRSLKLLFYRKSRIFQYEEEVV